MDYLTHDELRKVLATAASYGKREACMFILGYGHALRCSEIAALTLADIRGGKIVCRRGKGSVKTTEALRAHEIDALAAWLKERGDGDGSCFVFTSREGSKLHRSQVYRLFRKIAELAGIDAERAHPHILKHSLAAHLVRANVTLPYIQAAMGHAHVSSTVRYTHITPAEAAEKSNVVVESVLAA